MGILNRDLIYGIADALGIDVIFDGDKLSGKMRRELNLSGLKMEVTAEIVSSHMMAGGDVVMVMARTLGNLGLLCVAKEVRQLNVVIDLHLLNAAKMDALSGWLEKQKPKSVNDAVRALEPAIVASFVKLKKNEWSSAA